MKEKFFLFLTIVFILSSCSGHKKIKTPETYTLKDVKILYVEVGDRYVKISWELPDDSHVKKIQVNRKENYSIDGVTDGVVVYNDDLTTSVYDRSVSNGVTYFYKIFTSDGKIFSKGVEISATPNPPPDITPPAEVYDTEITGGNGYIKIRWKNPSDSDFAGVLIVKREDSCPQSEEDGETTYSGKGTEVIDRDVENFHKYCYRIFTYDTSGNYSSGILLHGEPMDLIPPPEIPVFYAAAASQQVILSWINPDDPDFYTAEIFKDSVLIYNSSGTEEVYFDKSVSPATTYTYLIRSCDKYNNCTAGISKTVTTPTGKDLIPPSSVKNFQVSPYPPGNGLILRWQLPSDPDFAFVEVYVQENSCSTLSRGIKVYSGVSTGFTDFTCTGNCLNGDKYCYTIYSVDASLNYSSPVTGAGIPQDSVPPPPVTDLMANCNNSGYITTTWKNPDSKDLYGYKLFVINRNCLKNIYTPHELENSSSHRYPVIITPVTDHFTDENPPLPSDREHLCYAISAIDRYGNMSAAPATTVVVHDNIPPGKIRSLTAQPQPDGSIYFTWKYPSSPDVKGVKILRRTARGSDDDYFLPCSGSEIASVFYPDSQFLDQSIQGATGAYYNYTFCAYDEWQNYSIPYDIMVRSYDSQPPGKVENLVYIVDPNGKNVYISWDNPSDPDFAGVLLLRREDGYPVSPTDPFSEKLLNGEENDFTDFSVLPDHRYYYAIYSYDNNENYSDGVSFSVLVKDIQPPEDVKNIIFHDPITTNVITLSWKNPTDADFNGVTIIKNSSPPATRNDGKIIYRGKGEEITFYQPRGELNFYAFYTSDTSLNYSKGVTSAFAPAWITGVTGGSYGEDLSLTKYGKNIFILYYSSALSLGIILEKRTLKGDLILRKTLSKFASPEFLSIAHSNNYIWTLLGRSDRAEIYKISPDGTVMKKKAIEGQWKNGKLISCGSRVNLILSSGNSAGIVVKINEDFSSSSYQIPISPEFSALCYGNLITYTHIDDQIHLTTFYNGDITSEVVRNYGGYSPEITWEEETWRILFQSYSPFEFYTLSSSGYQGEITDEGWYPSFVSDSNFIFYNPDEGEIFYGKILTDSTYLIPIASIGVGFLKSFYSTSITGVIYSDINTYSLNLLTFSSIIENDKTLIKGNYFTYLKAVSTDAGDFLLLKDKMNNSYIFDVANNIYLPVTTSTEDISSAGGTLDELRIGANGNLFIVRYYPLTQTEEVLKLNITGDNGKICVSDKIMVIYDSGGSLYADSITFSTGITQSISQIPVAFNSYSLSCSAGKFYAGIINGGTGNYNLYLYDVSSGPALLWQKSLSTNFPFASIRNSETYIDVFVNDNGISWYRLDSTGQVVNSSTVSNGTIPALFNENNSMKYLTFKDLYFGDLYLGRFLNDRWYYGTVDTIGDTGNSPSVITGKNFVKIYYISDGAIYRALLPR